MKEIPYPLKLFYSYALADEEWLKKLEIQLTPLVRHQKIAPWHRQMIVPGQDEKQEIETHLNSAQIILLLISPDFIASDQCYGTEMMQAMKRHEAGEALVIPIILRPVSWEDEPFSKLLVLPTNGQPISNWMDTDEALHKVAEGIQRAINDFVNSEEPFTIENVKNIFLKFSEIVHKKYILDICFTINMPGCISTSHDRSIVFYNIERHKVEFALKNLQDDIQAIACHPPSNRLAGVNQRGEIILWDTRTYQQEKMLFSGERYLTDVAFSGDGMFLCAISRKGTGWCWRTDAWNMSHIICQFHDAARSITFSLDSIYLAIACLNGDLVIWNCQTWTQVNSHSFDGEITTVQFIPGQPILALGFEHGEIQLWDYERSSLLASLIQHRERITDLVALRNGQLLFSSGNDQRLVAWDLKKRKLLFEVLTGDDTPLALAIHPRESILAVGTASGRILWYATRK